METTILSGRLWTHSEAAAFLGLTESGLYQLKDGPPWSKVGRVRRYDPVQVKAWFDARSNVPAP
jgi:hypothetical protein